MTNSEIISLVAVLGSFVWTGVNLWWQRQQERERALRSAAERDVSRTERLHEHWLDTKITVYRRFLTSLNDAQAQTSDRINTPSGLEDHARILYEVADAREALNELELVAPVATAEAAEELFRLATFTSGAIQTQYKWAANDRARRDRLAIEYLENEERIGQARALFRDRVRAELGLDVYSPPARQEPLPHVSFP